MFTRISPLSLPCRRLTSRRTDQSCPAHSPDIPHLDYFLWWYLKDKVCANNSQIIIDLLMNNIRTEISVIPHEVLDRVITVLNVRVATVMEKQQRQGALIEQIMNFWAVLATWLCTRHHTKHTCKTGQWNQIAKYPFQYTNIQNATFSKMNTIFLTILSHCFKMSLVCYDPTASWQQVAIFHYVVERK